jgi:hypothetical protein
MDRPPRRAAPLLALLAAFAPAARAQSPEFLRLDAEQSFAAASPAPLLRAASRLRESSATLQPALQPRAAGPLKGAVLARVTLAAQLDKNLHVTSAKFGARALDLGVATDAGFKSFYLGFSDASSVALAAVGEPRALIGGGVNARIDAKTVYNFRLAVNIFDPVKGSTLEMTPVSGTAGASSSINTGSLLSAVRARAAVFDAGGAEYWLFYGRDALADGSGFAATRSLLFVREDGLSTRTWPLAAAALKTGVPASVSLGGTTVTLTLGADGVLVVSR